MVVKAGSSLPSTTVTITLYVVYHTLGVYDSGDQKKIPK